jgi:hypothetical protein
VTYGLSPANAAAAYVVNGFFEDQIGGVYYANNVTVVIVNNSMLWREGREEREREGRERGERGERGELGQF